MKPGSTPWSFTRRLALASCLAVLAACGGGDDATTAPDEPSATQRQALATAAATGAAHYVAATGDDAAPGTAAQPWRSLARVQAAIDSATLRPGDSLLFRRGDAFFGTLNLGAAVQGNATAPILLAAYGSGAAPLLHGMSRLQGWQSLGAGRWRAVCAPCAATPALLRIDGVVQGIARWPNADEADRGYRYFSATNGRTSITDATLPAAPNWAGGELVVRSIAWVLDRLPISAQSAGRIDTSVPATYALQVGYGYFIQNHPGAIDREGEWSFSAADRSITLQSARDPNTLRIEVPVRDTLVQVRGAAHVELRDLAIEGATRRAVDAQDCTALRLRRVLAGFVGDMAVRVDACAGAVVEDSVVAESMNVGLHMIACPACSLQRTTIRNIGLIAGMGANGDGAYVGAEVGGMPGRPATLVKTSVSGTGYIGVSLAGQVTMRGSLVRDFNQVKVDGAGIYTWGRADITIVDNTVLDAGGTTAGTPWGSTATHGIYIDDNSERVTVTRNTIGRVGASGVFLHNTRDVNVTDNLIFAPGEAGILLGDDALGSYALERTRISGNTVVASGVPMLDVSSTLTDALFSTLGSIDANMYCDPFAAPTLRVGLPASGRAALSLAQWHSRYGHDTAASVCADRRAAFTVSGTPGPNRVVNGSFDRDLAGWFGWPADTLDARWESGRLDAGSLRLGFAGPAPQLHFDNAIGAVTAGSAWWLEFSLVGVAGAPAVEVYLRQGGAPYARLGNSVSVAAEAGRTEHSVLLDASRAEADALLIFELARPGSAVGIDNVRLRPVTATRVALGDVARLETNAAALPRSFTVQGEALHTADGTVYAPGAVVTLAPYRGMVLLRP